jgi:hypothetical protein
METTEIKAESISQTENSSPLSDFQTAALDAAEKALEALRKEQETKKYLVDLEKAEIETLNKFILEDASWKFTESLGILEVEKDLKNAVKNGKLFVGAVTVEAIYYYMSKVEGNGKKTNAKAFSDTANYIKVLKGISGALERIKADTEKVRQAEFVVAARKEGIEPASN